MGRETLPLPAPSTPAAATTSNPVAVAAAAAPTSLAPGFRFHPTDEELIIYYLKRKVCGKSFRFDAISEVDIYRSEPWDLADKSRLKTRDQEWYFFSALDKKYGNGGRMNRATSKGYWKATGNDRPVRHEQRTVGLKKTLVFHSGRAPDGKRTNWVMHEYRLVDEELERAGTGSTQDAYVLCRVFHKNNIGPPNGQRYAPFIEEEWDDASALVPGAEPMDEVPIACYPHVDGNGHAGGVNNVVQGEGNISGAEIFPPESSIPLLPSTSISPEIDRTKASLPKLVYQRRKQLELVQQQFQASKPMDSQSVNKVPFDVNKLPIETQNLLAVCKRESMDEYPSPEKDNSKQMDEYPLPQTDTPKPFSQIYKRRRHNLNSNHSNLSTDSIQTCQDPFSFSTTAATTLPTTPAATTTNTAAKKHFLSALVEFSLLESLEPKESPSVDPPEFDAANLDSSVPHSCVKLIQHLQSEIRKLSVERETMRFEVTSAQAMINILQSRIDLLNKENDELRKITENR